MQKAVFLALGMLLTIQSFAQEYTTISGNVLDLETKEALSFATINIQNKPIGVVANDEGEFEFSFLKKYLSDTIVFSMAGYQTEKALAQSLANQDKVEMELASKAVLLSEVVITDKALTPWDILQLAISNIRNNYPTKPYEFKAFYRDYKQENQECKSIFEAAISVFDHGYSKVANKHSFKEKVVLEQVRKSLAVEYQSHVFKRFNIMKELLKLNDVRYQSRALDKRNDYNYEHGGYVTINDRLMHKIMAEDDWVYSIYVDVATYAISRIEMDFKWEDGVAENEWIRDTIKYQQRSAQQMLEFQLIDGIYYPKYGSFTTNTMAFDPNTDELLFTFYLLQEYMVTDIDFDPEVKPKKSDRMNPELAIEKQEFTYDPEFWEHYNIIKFHPRNEELIKGLEERMNLEDQFSASYKGRKN